LLVKGKNNNSEDINKLKKYFFKGL